MKNILKILTLVLAICIAIFMLTACNKKAENTENESSNESTNVTATEVAPEENNEVVNVPKNEQIGTAGSNIPLKDNLEEAKYQIEVAMQHLFEESYGNKVFDARIYVTKMYTTEEEQEIPELKERNLGPDEVAFEVNYELRPAEGVDPIEFTAASGVYDEETGWVKEKYNLGILRPTESGDQKYIITDFGTGW